jgi:hypothetical protein
VKKAERQPEKLGRRCKKMDLELKQSRKEELS